MKFLLLLLVFTVSVATYAESRLVNPEIGLDLGWAMIEDTDDGGAIVPTKTAFSFAYVIGGMASSYYAMEKLVGDESSIDGMIIHVNDIIQKDFSLKLSKKDVDNIIDIAKKYDKLHSYVKARLKVEELKYNKRY